MYDPVAAGSRRAEARSAVLYALHGHAPTESHKYPRFPTRPAGAGLRGRIRRRRCEFRTV